MTDPKKEITPLLQAPGNDNSPAASVDQASRTSEDPAVANPPEVAAVDEIPQTLPRNAGRTLPSASPLEADAAINHRNTNQNKQPQSKTFARYLVICHSDRDKDILKINPTAIQKAPTIMIGEDFSCTRYESAKMVEIHVRNKRSSEILLGLEELDCTEFKVPVKVTKHKTKNSCKGVIHCGSIGQTPKPQILRDMEKHHVSDIYRLTRTENGVQRPLDTYIVTFDSETRPPKIDMGFGEIIKVSTYYPNPRLCRNCQRYGHGHNTCRNKQVCAKCGQEGHAYGDCDKDSHSCYHCKANHSSSSKDCPMFVLEKRVLKQMTDDRSTPLAARRKVYRDSQDLVRQIPSLSSYITGAQYSTVVASSKVINPNRQNQQSTQNPPQTPALNPTQPTFDPSSLFDHPLFKSLVEQQDICMKQQQSMLEQQSQNKVLMQSMMGMMTTMMGLISKMMLPSSQHNIQQFAEQFKQLEKDVDEHKTFLSSDNNTPTHQNDPSGSAMETTSSSKRSHSNSSDMDDELQAKKVAVTKQPSSNDVSSGSTSVAKPEGRHGASATPSVSDTEGQDEPPRTGSKSSLARSIPKPKDWAKSTKPPEKPPLATKPLVDRGRGVPNPPQKAPGEGQHPRPGKIKFP